LNIAGVGVSSVGAVNFTSAGTLSNTVEMSAAASIGGSADGTVSGVISGTGPLTKVGAGVLTLSPASTANTYSNATTISAGTLRVGSANNAVPDTSAVSLAGTAIFDVNGNTETVGSVASADTDSKITLGIGTLTSGDTTSTTFAGVIEGGVGTGALTKQGTGILTLSGANTFDGALTISAGTVSVGAGGSTGSIATQSVVNSGTLIFNRSNAITYAGVVSGTGALQKSGADTLTLSNANTYSGNTTIDSSGTILVTGTLGANVSPASYGGQISVGSSGTFSYGSTSNQTLTGKITGAGAMSKSGASTLTLSPSSASDYTGLTTVSAGTIKITTAASLGNASGNTVVSGTGAVHIDGTTDLTVDKLSSKK
jgi:fibronectin-binding autotransporter adhesin